MSDQGEGSWESGYVDPLKGHVLVPFDLKNDVILPLERMEDRLDSLEEKLDLRIGELDKFVREHHDGHETWVAHRKLIEKWVVRTVATIVPLAVAGVARYIYGVGL